MWDNTYYVIKYIIKKNLHLCIKSVYFDHQTNFPSQRKIFKKNDITLCIFTHHEWSNVFIWQLNV